MLSIAQVGEYSVCTLNIHDNKKNYSKPKVKIVLVIDNSGSMDHLTKDATNTIGKSLFSLDKNRIDMQPGIILLFSEKSDIISENIRSADDLDKIRYPFQGQTNITGAIEKTIEKIVSVKDPSVHFLVAFLSDGQHNCGPILNSNSIKKMREQLNKNEIKLSIIVVGISNSDTSLGMQIKSGLETVPMNSLESIYYAKDVRAMNNILSELNRGCIESLSNGLSLDLRVNGCLFFDTMKNKMSTFMFGEKTIFITKGEKNHVPEVFVNEIKVETRIERLTPNHISAIIDSVVPRLSQRRIASGIQSIQLEISELEKFIKTAEDIFTNLRKKELEQDSQSVENIGKIKMTPGERVRMIKTVRQAQVMFQEERNRLKELLVSIENDSSKQAQFLIGMNKKYSTKAVIRADTINITVNDVIEEIKKFVLELIDALKKDNRGHESKTSILSLNNAFEQLEEWVTVLEDDIDYQDIYSVLVAFGIFGYSVKFQQNNAVQMDPFQTNCLAIEPCPIDTNNVLLANQMRKKIESHSRIPITDCLILVDPTCPNASLLVMRKSSIYQYNCSITLCRDLYMYHPKMTFSMHAHSLLKCVDEYCNNRSTVYLDLAVRILYSIRKYWSNYAVEGENVELFKHWYIEWNTITQAERDKCNHPVQPLLMLGAYDFKQLGINYEEKQVTPPLVNLLNEVMARTMKMILVNTCAKRGMEAHETKKLAVKIMQELFNITPENSPKPDPDIMVQEPTMESIRESCEGWTETGDEVKVLGQIGINDDIITFVNKILLPYVRTYHLGMIMQEYMKDLNLSWDHICERIEDIGSIPEDLLDYMSKKMEQISNMSVTDYLGIGEDRRKAKQVSECILLQSVLHHDSGSRIDIDEKDVFDSNTLKDLIIDLRIEHYMEASKVKRQKWLAVIGDVTYAEALSCDEFRFAEMIGRHTHGHNGSVFWSLIRATKNDARKREIFQNKSCSSVATCFNKI